MWREDKMEWPQEDDEFGFGFAFLYRMLGVEESSYGDEGYYEKDIVPLDYRLLNYGICK